MAPPPPSLRVVPPPNAVQVLSLDLKCTDARAFMPGLLLAVRRTPRLKVRCPIPGYQHLRPNSLVCPQWLYPFVMWQAFFLGHVAAIFLNHVAPRANCVASQDSCLK